jgi:excisionase family DNA binding protein
MEFSVLAKMIKQSQSQILGMSEQPENTDIIVGAKEAAKVLNVSLHTVVQAVQNDRILAIRIGKKLYFSRKWLDDFSKSENRFNR